MALIKIAWRNIKEHKVKTLIIGIIITLGITILVIGNSMMDTAGSGIEKNYINNYTGNLIITADTKMNISLFGIMEMSNFDKSVPVIPQFFKVQKYAEAHPDIQVVSAQAAGRVLLDFGEDVITMSMLFGIDPLAYRKMFPDNIEIISGAFLEAEERGLMLSEKILKRIKKNYEIEIEPGDKVLLTGISSGMGAKIRELPVKGIFKFKSSNIQLDMVCLVDIDSLRALNGMTLGAELEVKTQDNEIDLIEHIDDEVLFGNDEALFNDIDDLFNDNMIEDTSAVRQSHTEDSLYSILGDTSEREQYSQIDSGAWHFMLIKLKSPDSLYSTTNDLNNFFNEKGILAKVSDWKSGAGPIGQMADVLKNAFNIIVLIIAIVAIIIIMNTLVISITERISEIGTMRALGAQKGFIWKMIIMETVMISAVFGLIGIILGCIILGIMGLTGIEAPNMFFEIIFGGKILYPVTSIPTLIQSLIIIIMIGMLSSLYPVYVALKIQPVKAIQSD